MTNRGLAACAALACVVVLGSPAVAQFGGGGLTVNVPLSGIFHPGLPIDGSGKPFIDYQFTVNAPGTYQFDLISSSTSSYDPYLIVMQNGVQIASNDDANGLNSRIVTFLQPGYYVIRVTRFGTGPVSFPVSFTLTAMAAVAPVPIPVPTPMAFPLTDAAARVLATQYYATQSEWAGQYAITILRTRVVPTGPTSAEVHIRYSYTCLLGRCGGSRTGLDQRVFYYQLIGSQWSCVRMGPHMSAIF
jgi:hypothetical protein